MYGSSVKLGRGGGGGGRGGGGGGKRNIHSTFHPSGPNRTSSVAGRPSSAGSGAAPRNRAASALVPASSAPSSSATTEETYSLVTSNPLNFAMTIRLAPNLVEEIKRVEARGGVARIKFDGNINNPVGNIISVDGKEFRFTWSPETGDLCDIYEECRSGEDGNGLLVESGSAWRKLNVQRVLDESTKNHVKLRSEEAERKLKSRKAIVLDSGNPSTKSQIKALAAAESNPWRKFKTKKEHPPSKKRKVESVSGPPKSVHKSGPTGTPPTKGQAPSSPLAPPSDLGASASPFGSVNITKGHANTENVSTQDMNRTPNYDRDFTGRLVNSSLQEKSGSRGTKINQPSDLQAVLISLLMESSFKGMSLKALEKAAEDAIPNSARQIEPILKKIATFQAPGRYFLKPGVENESLKKPLSERQSFPGDSLRPPFENENKYDMRDHSEHILPMKTDTGELDEKIQLRSKSEEQPGFLEKVDALHADLFGEKKISDNSEGPAVSSSDSGSDSDSGSESSDSGSDSGSHSRSRSRSLAGSGSGSSSDSESEASTNSKDVSDEEVDIMTSNDDEEKNQMHSSGSVLPKSPVVSGTMDGEHGFIEINERRGAHNKVDIDKDLPMSEHVSELVASSDSFPTNRGRNHVEEIGPYHPELQDRQDHSRKVDSERDFSNKGGFNHELSESTDKVSRGKSKRALDEKTFDAKPDSNKRSKAGNSSQQHLSGSRSAASIESRQNPSDRPSEDTHRSSSSQMANRVARDGGPGFDSQNGYSKVISGKSLSDSQEPLRSANPFVREKAAATIERSSKHSENVGHNVKHPEKSHRMDEGFASQKVKSNGETKEDRYLISSKGSSKSSKEGFRDKRAPSVDLHERSVSQTVNAVKDDEANTLNISAGNGRPDVLRRELSDLELGELREPSPEETPAYSRQTGRKSSSKHTENMSLGLDALNSNTGKGKPPGKLTANSVHPAPTNSNIPSSSILEGTQKRVNPQQHAEDIQKPHHRASQSMRPHLPRIDDVDILNQSNRGIEMGGRDRLGDAERSVETAAEVHGKPHGRLKANVPEEQGAQVANIPPRKESRKPKPNTLPDLNDKHKDTSLTGSSDSSHRRRESSSDESSCPYSKYEKEEPQLKGPIREFSEYAEYVKEYQEKYDIYVSLNKVLESSREEFLRHQREIEASFRKDPERYYKLVRQIKESFGQSAERHKRLKKIFFILHEELANLKQKIQEFAAPYLKNK